MKKVLVYGFGPFEGLYTNITEVIVRQIRQSRALKTAVFDVKFSKAMFTRVLREVQPDVVIGMGQRARTKSTKLFIERKAVNVRAERGDDGEPIAADGPEVLTPTLQLPRFDYTTYSYNAGTYVCNFSMYVVLQHFAKRDTQFGFIHVP